MTKTKAQPVVSDNPNHPSIKYPELWTSFSKLKVEKQAIHDKAAPLREKRDVLTKQVQELEVKQEALRKQIEAIEHPRLSELDRQIAGLARAMGARHTSDSPSQQEA